MQIFGFSRPTIMRYRDAVETVIDEEEFGSIVTAAIGDAKNDIPMLTRVDHPFLVRKSDGSYERDARLPAVRVTKKIGPDGFAEAINYLDWSILAGYLIGLAGFGLYPSRSQFTNI